MPDFLHADKDNFSDDELMQEEKIRPQSFRDFAGQRKTLDNLEVFVAAAKNRGSALDHVLLHGPPGLGKTTWLILLQMNWALVVKLLRSV
jgi:Holliday junction DNA helicase RuvB